MRLLLCKNIFHFIGFENGISFGVLQRKTIDCLRDHAKICACTVLSSAVVKFTLPLLGSVKVVTALFFVFVVGAGIRAQRAPATRSQLHT